METSPQSEKNCQSCKFNGDRFCAVNPNYWVTHSPLSRVSDSEKSALRSFIPDQCPDWEGEKEVTITITLTMRELRELARSSPLVAAGRKLLEQAIASEHISPYAKNTAALGAEDRFRRLTSRLTNRHLDAEAEMRSGVFANIEDFRNQVEGLGVLVNHTEVQDEGVYVDYCVYHTPER